MSHRALLARRTAVHPVHPVAHRLPGEGFDSFLWPLLGFFFLPLTTVAYSVAENEFDGGASSTGGVILIVIAVLLRPRSPRRRGSVPPRAARHRLTGGDRCRRPRVRWDDEPRSVLSRRPGVVPDHVRRAHPRPARRVAADRRRASTPCSSRRPARARRSPRSSGRSTGWPPHRLPSPASAHAACSTSRRCGRSRSTSRRTSARRSPGSGTRPSGSARHCPTRPTVGDAHRRHARRRTGAGSLRTPPDVLITTPESLYLMLTSQPREILRSRRGGDRRRDPRARGDQARRAPRSVARAARRADRRARRSASGCRPRSARSRRSRGSSAATTTPAPRGRSRSSTPAAASDSRSRWSSRSRTWASSAHDSTSPRDGPAAAGPRSARASGPRSTRGCSS